MISAMPMFANFSEKKKKIVAELNQSIIMNDSFKKISNATRGFRIKKEYGE